ncbi:hypothetical protein OF83DRAFT_1029189, partial [Amylostereum chailletii]
IVDKNRNILGMGHSLPAAPSWTTTCSESDKVMGLSLNLIKDWEAEELHHHRGDYCFLTAGFSHGGGQSAPSNCTQGNNQLREAVERALLDNPNIQNAGGFGDAGLATTAPSMYQYYYTTMRKLKDRCNHLKFPYKKSLYACTTFNFGPQAVTFAHTDYMNLANGFCSILALGNYDYKKGGHLVLHSLKLIIKFPPNTTFTVMSACCVHSNTAIAPHEYRRSIMQYSAGGLFRWVENNFRRSKK